MLFQRGKAYSQDLRERVLAAAEGGMPVGRIATMLLVSVSYVSKVLSRHRLTEVRTALPQVCHVAPKLGALMEAIRAQVAAQPDATLRELTEWVQASHGVSVSSTAMWKALRKLGLWLKKVAPGGRAGARGCCRSARGMARSTASARCQAAHLHR